MDEEVNVSNGDLNIAPETNVDEIEQSTETKNDTEIEINPNEEGVVEDISEIEFGEEDLIDPNAYKFGEYDLEKYKDNLNLEDEETVQAFKDTAKELKEMGFTQTQVEWFVEREIANNEEVAPKKPTNAEIKENLNKSLTREEKSNYNGIKKLLADSLSGTELDKHIKSLETNDTMVKILNKIYKKSLNQTGTLNNKTPRPKQKQMSTMSFEDAYGVLTKAINNKSLNEKTINDLRSRVDDKEKFNQILKVIGK